MTAFCNALVPATDRITMPDSPLHEDHWRRLAADLGLEVGPEPESSEHLPEPVERLERPRAEPEPGQSGRGPRRRPPEPEQPIAGFGGGLEPAEDVEPSARGRGGPPVGDDREEPEWPRHRAIDESNEADIEESDVESAAVPEVNPDAAEEAGSEIVGEKTGKRRRRRRSRRKKDGPAPAGEAGPGDDLGHDDRLVPSEPVAASDDDDDPAEEVSNWDVPSWDELIGSLHRPER
jgi:hypothetical protein